MAFEIVADCLRLDIDWLLEICKGLSEDLVISNNMHSNLNDLKGCEELKK